MMRAKARVINVIQHNEECEEIHFIGVTPEDGYPEDGTDENNTYARWTPHFDLSMTIQNPNLIGKIKHGDEFYIDFTKVE